MDWTGRSQSRTAGVTGRSSFVPSRSERDSGRHSRTPLCRTLYRLPLCPISTVIRQSLSPSGWHGVRHFKTDQYRGAGAGDYSVKGCDVSARGSCSAFPILPPCSGASTPSRRCAAVLRDLTAACRVDTPCARRRGGGGFALNAKRKERTSCFERMQR